MTAPSVALLVLLCGGATRPILLYKWIEMLQRVHVPEPVHSQERVVIRIERTLVSGSCIYTLTQVLCLLDAYKVPSVSHEYM